MTQFLFCPSCGEVAVKESALEAKVRGRVLVIKGENAFTICKGCSKEVRVPIKFDHTLMKSLHSSQPRLFISSKNKK